jgi:hypothetical protein
LNFRKDTFLNANSYFTFRSLNSSHSLQNGLTWKAVKRESGSWEISYGVIVILLLLYPNKQYKSEQTSPMNIRFWLPSMPKAKSSNEQKWNVDKINVSVNG